MKFSTAFCVALELLLWIAISEQQFNLGSKKAIMQRFCHCRRIANIRKTDLVFISAVRIKPIAGKRGNSNMGLNCKFMIPKTLSNNLRIVANVWKCDTSGNPDSCEYILKNHKVNNVCSMLGAKNEVWTVFTDHTDMPTKCPIEKGNYSMTEIPITTDFMQYLPMQDALWKVELNGYDAKRHIACIEFEMVITLNRN